MALVIGKIVLVAAIVAALFTAVEIDAKADDPFMHDATMFCRLLDQDHSPAGVRAAILSPLDAGVPEDVATSFINYALTNLCPEFLDDFNAAYDLYVGGARKRMV